MRHFPMDRMPVRHRFGGGGWEIGHLVLTLVFIAALIALTVWLITMIRRNHHAMPMMTTGAPTLSSTLSSAEAALGEARMRYARGELTRDQYVQIATDLGARPVGPPPATPEQPTTPE